MLAIPATKLWGQGRRSIAESREGTFQVLRMISRKNRTQFFANLATVGRGLFVFLCHIPCLCHIPANSARVALQPESMSGDHSHISHGLC